MSVESCAYHPSEPAGIECSGCHRRFCHQCIKEISGTSYCEVCKAELVKQQVISDRGKRLGRDGLRLIALGTPFAVILLIDLLGGEGLDMISLGALAISLLVFTGGAGLMFFLTGMMRSKDSVAPLSAVVVGLIYLVAVCVITPLWVEENPPILEGGNVGVIFGWSLFVLLPGLVPLMTGLLLLTKRRLKKGRSFG